VTTAGELVGTHAGIGGYTVGQRRRLPAGDEARYVTRIDALTNTIVIGGAGELQSTALVADEVNLIRAERFAHGPLAVLAMTRYRAQPAPATASIDADGTLDVAVRRTGARGHAGPARRAARPRRLRSLAGATIREAA